MKKITGSGGKGKSSKAKQPVEERDSLFSTSYINVIDLISEGEIAGLKDGGKSVYIDNTPLIANDGSASFDGITLATRQGTQDQTFIPGFDEVLNEISVGIEVNKETPITRTITDTAVNAARILITVPSLQKFKSNGDVVGTYVDLKIQVQYNGGGYSTVIDDRIKGKASQPYQKQYLVNLSGQFPVNIRVLRETENSTSSTLSNSFFWTSYTEVTYARTTYPNSALVALRVSSEQFSSTPQRAYLIRGLKIKIPSNGTVDQITGRIVYSGIWDGTFGAAQWTNDPAWCLWDLLTSTRYGLGDHIKPAQLDKWSFYAASQYCSEAVPDGFGGWEPRFSCNINIQSAKDAYDVINELSSVFRAMPYWSAGSIAIGQDRPSDPVYLFTNANVENGDFNYSNSSSKTRPTAAIVQYMDLELRDSGYEVVEDEEAIAKYGVIRQDIVAVACTSRGQAHRLGKWLLYSEQNEKEVCKFSSSLDSGVIVRPGVVIKIQDSMKNNSRHGGRIYEATPTTITVDDAGSLVVGANARISAILSDGTIQSRAVSGINGNIVTVSSAFSSVPNKNSIWVFENDLIAPTTWRVLLVEEDEGSGGIKYSFTCIAHNPSKYNYIEQGIALEKRKVTYLNQGPESPKNLVANQVIYETAAGIFSNIAIGWSSVLGINSYKVSWRLESGNWTSEVVSRNSYEILDAASGVYEINVSSINSVLQISKASTLTYQAFGDTNPPETPTGLTIVAIDQSTARISWNRAKSSGVLLGGKVLIRHNSLTSGVTWENSQLIVNSAAGSEVEKQVPLLPGMYLIKFENAIGIRSINAATVTATLPSSQPRLTIRQFREHLESPPFTGIYANMTYSAANNEILLVGAVLVDSIATDGNWDALPSLDSIGGISATGQYEFGETLILPLICNLNVKRYLDTKPYIANVNVDDYAALIDTWSDSVFSGSNTGDRVNASVYVRASNDAGPSFTWSEWREFSNGIVTGRSFQFKLVATSDDIGQSIGISQISVDAELQQRVEASSIITTSMAPYNVTFANAFYQAPSVSITPFDMDHADDFLITNVTSTGFSIEFKQGGSYLSRQFTYSATGYGGIA